MATVRVNGDLFTVNSDVLSYEDVLELAGFPKDQTISVTWSSRRPGTGHGTLMRGEHVTPIDGVDFNAYHTGSA